MKYATVRAYGWCGGAGDDFSCASVSYDLPEKALFTVRGSILLQSRPKSNQTHSILTFTIDPACFGSRQITSARPQI